MGYTPPALAVTKIAGGWSLTSPSTTAGDVLHITANSSDTYGAIKIIGGGSLYLYMQGGLGMRIHDGGSEVCRLTYTDPDYKIEVKQANKNLSFITSGTGMVKFGTYDATPALASSGFIPILDAAGNTRKLMVQA